MGCYLQAIVGTDECLRSHAADFAQARAISLAQGIALIPLTD
jgi:hypothetical protein